MIFAEAPSLDLTVMIPARNERGNLTPLIERMRPVLDGMGITYEILVIDGGSTDGTAEEARFLGARVVDQEGAGYGNAQRTGFKHARGAWIANLDGDMSHDPAFIAPLYNARHDAEIVICSRYRPFSFANQGTFRLMLSRFLNLVFRNALSLPIFDLSSGFRLYKREAIAAIDFEGRDFDVLIEILVRAFCEGFRVKEIPFHYHPRLEGVSNVRLIRFAISYLKTLWRLWKLRNSIDSADYDARAFYSLIWPQRYWQRKRYDLVREMVEPRGKILDIGCGSSLILVSLPGSIGLDVSHRKLRCMRGLGPGLVQGVLKHLPFPDHSFDQVICSQVIEHIARDEISFDEMLRVLKPGGNLIVGTPDYGRVWWPMIEWIYHRVIPGGYADEHITHFTRESLTRELESRGVSVDKVEYILGGEMIMQGRAALEKPTGC